MKCWTQRKAQEWKDAIEATMKTFAKDYTQPNRYDSFAPPRLRAHAQWCVGFFGFLLFCADAIGR